MLVSLLVNRRGRFCFANHSLIVFLKRMHSSRSVPAERWPYSGGEPPSPKNLEDPPKKDTPPENLEEPLPKKHPPENLEEPPQKRHPPPRKFGGTPQKRHPRKFGGTPKKHPPQKFGGTPQKKTPTPPKIWRNPKKDTPPKKTPQKFGGTPPKKTPPKIWRNPPKKTPLDQTPPCGQTHACENITLAKPSFRPVKMWKPISFVNSQVLKRNKESRKKRKIYVFPNSSINIGASEKNIGSRYPCRMALSFKSWRPNQANDSQL